MKLFCPNKKFNVIWKWDINFKFSHINLLEQYFSQSRGFFVYRTMVPFAKNSWPNGLEILLDAESYDYALSSSGSEGLIISVIYQVSNARSTFMSYSKKFFTQKWFFSAGHSDHEKYWNKYSTRFFDYK